MRFKCVCFQYQFGHINRYNEKDALSGKIVIVNEKEMSDEKQFSFVATWK